MYQLLYVKSCYSLLSSLLSIDEIISLNLQMNSKCAVICDDNMYGVMEFIKKCNDNKLKPVIGLSLKLDNDDSILAYVKNYQGYLNLIKLSTLQNMNKLTLDDIIARENDLIFVLPFKSLNRYSFFKDKVSELYLGYSNKKEEMKVLLESKNIVFLRECLYASSNDKDYLKYLLAIKDGKSISDNLEYDILDKEFLIDNILTMSSNEGLINSKKICDECNLVFPKSSLLLPLYECPNNLSSDIYLKELSIKGLSKRLNNKVTSFYQERLLYELNVINKMGFANYFLVVYDFIKYAKMKNILVGPGRGSAAGSLVAYSLGITEIDPLKYNLLFERFLNPERISMPDIDTDMPDLYRDEIINYVKEKYGKEKVAGIVTFSTLASKQVIRDVGRVLEIPLYKIDKLNSFIPNMSHEKLDYFYTNNKDFREYINSDLSLQNLYKIAKKIEGFPRQIGTHAAGIVMCSLNLDEVIPLTVSDDMYLTSYSMNYLEELGLLKMDFLGIKNLTLIMNVLKDIKNSYNKDINFNQIPLDDMKVFDLFKKSATTGIFQFESTGMRNFLRKLKPNSFEDIIAAIALFRPGPAANIDTYIARKEGREKVFYPDKSLEGILKNTYGIMIYQEQVMQTASIYAGYSLGEADILRRAISKKKASVLDDEEKHFLEKARELKRDDETAKKIFALIKKFAGYGFNRSHAVAYSLIAYKMAYLKVYYPLYFYANLLSNVIGSTTKTKEYLQEARSVNLEILKPEINLSENSFVVNDNKIIFPFSSIKGLGVTVSKQIIEARGGSKFIDIFDCFSRLVINKITKRQLETLILADAFRNFSYNKKTLYTNLDALYNYASLTKDLDPSLVLSPDIIEKEEFSKVELLEQENDLFGFYISNHPTTAYNDIKGITPLSKIKENFNKNITVLVMIEKIKVIKTKKNDDMAFVDASDALTNLDFTFFPKTYSQYKYLVKGDICKITGKVEKRLNQYQIIVNKVEIVKGALDEEKNINI